MGYTIKQARVGVGYTQAELAHILGIHPQTYAKLEKHPEKMSIELAEKLCEATHLTMDDLIFLPNDSN
jgi:DNA-binding XRE family transcriptional regulator